MPKDQGIGASSKRREDVRFLTGNGQYTDDINRHGQAYAYFLRSNVAHGTINGIDTSAATAAPGVVGVFTAGGSVYESEIWTDALVLQPAYRRGSTFQSVFARLESPEAYQAYKDALTSDPRLEVDVYRETDYYAEQSLILRQMIGILGNLIATLTAEYRRFRAQIRGEVPDPETTVV